MTTNDFFKSVAKNIAHTCLEDLCDSEFVYVTDSSVSYLAQICDISLEEVIVQTIPSPRLEVSKELKCVQPFHIGGSLTVTHVDSIEQNYTARSLYLQSPKKIIAKGDSVEFFYDENDYVVQDVIDTFLLDTFFEDIPRGLHTLLERFSLPQINIFDSVSLGYILKTGSAYCRHRCGLIYLIGKEKGLDVDIEYSQVDSLRERHSFIIFNDGSSEFLIDPTIGLYGKRNDVLEQLKAEGKTTFYHTNTSKMTIELEF